MFRTAILTVGAAGAGGSGGDPAVLALRGALAAGPFVEVDYDVVPDEQALIRAKLRLWCDRDGVDLLLTCGGAELGLRERTPEATDEVIEREVPGLAERMRAEGARHDPLAVLSRGLAGVRRATLIVNLPAGADAAGGALRAILPVLPHALTAIRGESDAGAGAGPRG